MDNHNSNNDNKLNIPKSSSSSINTSFMRDSGLGSDLFSPPGSSVTQANTDQQVFNYSNISGYLDEEGRDDEGENAIRVAPVSELGASALTTTSTLAPSSSTSKINIEEECTDSFTNPFHHHQYDDPKNYKSDYSFDKNGGNNNNIPKSKLKYDDDCCDEDGNNKVDDRNNSKNDVNTVVGYVASRSKFIRMCTPIIDLVVPKGHQIHTNFTPPRFRSGYEMDQIESNDKTKWPCTVERRVAVDLRSVSDYVHLDHSGIGFGYQLHNHPHSQLNRAYSSSYPGAPSPLAEASCCMGVRVRRNFCHTRFPNKLDDFLL
ncbi:hypothetical protein HELRODRAFT_190927 [Helobdella robusta]|uniref:Uncharacterized protein n=1 Tax=Helobdella robusta TaxID=6412 RepID=T1FSF5_HELRO|nr:hypothetical protein HELRODRAFT_190927 [Helobdella robusta]ESO08182.1 hypothetical protein HELRODRAFT_190927 [Helobdella robusta]